MRRFASIFLTAVSFLLLAAPRSSAGTELRTIALSGQRAPGTPDGVVFSGFVSADPHTPVPLVDRQGQVLFFAFLAGPGVDATNSQGLWTFDGADTAIVARAGDPAPGTGPGVVFAGLPNGEVPLGFDISSGTSIVPATLRGEGVDFFNDDGIWKGDPSALDLVLREGQAAPGTGGTFFSPLPADFTTAGVLVASQLRGPGIDSDNDESIWSSRGGELVLHAREGAPAPGTTNRFGPGSLGAGPGTFPHAALNDAGQLLLRGNVLGTGITAYNDEALFIDRGSGLQLYLREGDRAPGAGNHVTFGGSSVQLLLNFPSINALGEVAFSVRLGGRKGKIPTNHGIYSDHLGSLSPVAIAGRPSTVAGKNWLVLQSPVLSDGSHIAFAGSVDPDFRPRFGIFWDQPGSVTTVILPGAPAPDRPGLTVYSAGIRGFNRNGFLVFQADLLDAASQSVAAVLSVEPNGTVHTLLAARDVVDVSNGGDPELRQVKEVQAGELGDDGTLALRLTFTDGSSGIFSVRLPGT